MSNIEKKRRKEDKTPEIMLFAVCMLAAVSVIGLITASVEGTRPIEQSAYEHEQIAYNTTALRRTNDDIEYIVIHDTDNPERGANAKNHFIYFNTGNRSSSADFFVDDTDVLQVNDYYNYYTWHCGDGGSDAKIRNKNSVAVEICVNSDGSYKQAVKNAAALTGRLMRELDVDINHVVRHKDASGKECPRSMSEEDWKKFKESALKYDVSE